MRVRAWIAGLLVLCSTRAALAEPSPATSPAPLLGSAGKYPRLSAKLLLQPQFLTSFRSQDGVEGANAVMAKPDGTTTNTSLFRLRRTRITLVGEMTPSVQVLIEVDPFPVGTGNIFMRSAYAMGTAHWGAGLRTEFSAGAIKVPLTSEILESSSYRPFLERSQVSRALVPSERDLGVMARTVVHEKLIVDTAIVNGRTFGEPSTGLLPDYNRGKDVVGRIKYDFGPVDVGAGWYLGTGSLNAPDGNVRIYRRGAASVEAALHHVLIPALGKTAVYTQLTYAQNMDRGLRNAFALPDLPSTPGADIEAKRQLGYWARIQQDIGSRFLVGFRHEAYSSNLALQDNLAHGFGGLCSFEISKGVALRQEYVYGIDSSHAEGQAAPQRVSHTLSTWLLARYD